MASNYSTWSLEKLKRESSRIEKAIKEKQQQEKKVAVAEIKALAKKHGFALSDLLGETTEDRRVPAKTNGSGKSRNTLGKAKKTAKRAKAKIKYRNPVNTTETWTGRGRQPRWVVDYIDNGGSIEDITL